MKREGYIIARRLRCAGAWLAMVVCCACARAGDLPAIARDLASDDFRVREAAQKSLEALPVGQINSLREFVKSEKDPEVQARFAARIAAMAEYLALHPTALSIDVENVRLDAIVKALNKQMGGDYLMSGDNLRASAPTLLFTIHAKEKTFAEILSEMNRQQLMLVMASPPMRLEARKPRAEARGNVANAEVMGEFQASEGFAVRTTIRRLGQARAANGEGYYIDMDVVADPRMWIVWHGMELREAKLVDDAGTNLVPVKMWDEVAGATTSGSVFPVLLTAAVPAVRGKSIEKLKGMMRVQIAVAEDVVVLDAMQPHPEFQMGTTTVKVETVAAVTGEKRLKVTLSRPPRTVLDVIRYRLMAEDRTIARGGTTGEVLGVSLPADAAGLKLELRQPSKVREVLIPLELKGLILP